MAKKKGPAEQYSEERVLAIKRNFVNCKIFELFIQIIAKIYSLNRTVNHYVPVIAQRKEKITPFRVLVKYNR